MLLALLAGCTGGGRDGVVAPDRAAVDSPRARLLGLLRNDGLGRGVWVLTDPGDADGPGTPLGPLLPLADGDLLVEAPGPVGLLAGVPADVKLPDLTRRVGDVVVLAEPGAALGSGLPPGLRRLAATTAPVAWAGQVQGGPVLVTLDGDALTVETALPVQVVRSGLAAPLPGSPGRRWRDLLADAVVTRSGGRTVLTARATDALPATLLRQLVDQGALPPR